MKMKSYAKLNLALNVIDKKKPMNLHDLDMINVCISLYDVVNIKVIKDKKNEVTITCNKKEVPLDESNLITKVIKKFNKTFKIDNSYFVKLTKNIPLNAGLGGGSSNAAATLRLLNNYYKTNMKPLEMIKFIQDITSDGPFFILSVPSRVRGTGNKISPLQMDFKQKVLLIKPKFGLSTKDIYSSLSYGSLRHPNMNKLESYVIDDNFPMFAKHADNSLMDAAITQKSEIKTIIQKLNDLGFELALMSGSGSSCFAMSNAKEPYKKYKAEFLKNDYELIGVYKIIKEKF